MTRSERFVMTAVLGLLAGLEAFTIDTSLPAMPAMADGLGTDVGLVQVSLGAFFIGMALGQLVHGPASDRFGRKPVLLVACILYVPITIWCGYVTSVETLTALRFVQGFAAAATQIVGRAVVRDRFDREDAARILSHIMLVLAIAPIVGPILGAHLTVAYGWRSIFVVFTAYGVVLVLLVWLLLAETIERRDPRALAPGRMLANYRQVLASRTYWGYMLCASSAFAALFAWLTGASGVMISYLGVSPETFSYAFATVMVGYLIMLIFGSALVRRFGLNRLLRVGIWLAAFAGVLMAALAWAGDATVAALVVPMFIYMAAFALILPQAMAGALSPFPHIAGAASSLQGFLQLSAGSAAGAMVGWFNDGTQLSMTTVIFISGMIGLVAYLALVRPTPSAPR